MANSWVSVHSDDQLRLSFISSQHLKWDRIIDDIGAIWNRGGKVVNKIVSSQRIAITAFNAELSWISIETIKGDEPGPTV